MHVSVFEEDMHVVRYEFLCVFSYLAAVQILFLYLVGKFIYIGP